MKKIGWICTYTPEEIIYAAGFNPYRLLPPDNPQGPGLYEDLLPAGTCPYARSILGSVRSGIYGSLEAVVVANSCNSMLHLYNALKELKSVTCILIDVPRLISRDSTVYFASELESMLSALEKIGSAVGTEALHESIDLYRQRARLLQKLVKGNGTSRAFPGGLQALSREASSTNPAGFMRAAADIFAAADGEKPVRNGSLPGLLLSGAIAPDGLAEMLLSVEGFRLYPENCSGLRYLNREPLPAIDQGRMKREEILFEIAGGYLRRPPCPRILDADARELYYTRLLDELKIRAVIYHDLMFCDICHYDYLLVKDLLERRSIPYLRVKTELGREDSGQLRTRVEAFIEMIDGGGNT